MESQNIILPPSLRSEDINEIENTFANQIDEYAGKLKISDFKQTVDNMEEKEKSLLILQLLDDLLALNAEEIDLDTFQNLVVLESNKCDAASLFNLFDVGATGGINQSNLKKVAREIGIDITDEELNEMIKCADKDGDGIVNPEEFAAFMLKSAE